MATGAPSTTDDSLRAYLGPQVGKTYVYDIEETGRGKISRTTVASADVQDKDSRVTCSPASTAEFPADLRKPGAQPLVSELEIKDGAIVSRRGKVETILLRAPLHPGPDLWQNRQSAVLPGGLRQNTIMHCGIAETGKRSVLGQTRAAVTVQCAGQNPPGSVLTSSTYADGIGLVQETTELTDNKQKLIGRYRQVLAEIRIGSDSCTALVKSLGPTKRAIPP